MATSRPHKPEAIGSSPICATNMDKKLKGDIAEQAFILECLKRELKEEFNIDVRIGEFLGSNTHIYDFGTIELMAYRTNWVKGDFKLNDHDEIRWVSTYELDQFMSIGFQN